jgi:hypothetical protein
VFRKMKLLPSSGNKVPSLLGILERANLNHVHCVFTRLLKYTPDTVEKNCSSKKHLTRNRNFRDGADSRSSGCDVV